MQISKNSVVSINYTLTNNEGEVLDTSEGHGPLFYLHGNGNLIPGLEKELEGKVVGNSFKVSVPPEEAYGLHDEEQVQIVPRTAFRGVKQVEPGMQFQVETEEGGQQVITVTDVDGDDITVDSNHPLAGQTLNFDVTIMEIREASAEELHHGHVHGPGGHHH
ncbi:MAG: peptidylprolyl isomerase [SAR324 cluster bacterium]|nr:peptidylprolyl isomerase [SAR324 cluster bacterium]